MKLNRTDYVLERASDGGYYALVDCKYAAVMLMGNLLKKQFRIYRI